MASKNYSANLKIGAVMASSVGRVFGTVNGKIKEQEATLKKLRAAYKDASKGTGEYVGKLDQLQREIAQTERGLIKLRAASRIDFGKSFKGIGGAFKGDMARAGVVGGVLSAAGLGIAKDMLDTTAAFEKSLTILKTVEGSQDKAKASFSWIQDFAQRTPFELQQVTDAFVRLRAYGIDPIRGDSLRVLGDTASAMGKDVMDAVEAIADAVTGENERLKEFGIKAAKDGAKITYTWTDRAGKQMAKTVDGNNRAMIQSTILAIWNSKYKGAMDEQSKTWNGMMSNMKDAWARFAYDVMQSGPFEGLKAQLGDFLKRLEVLSKDGTMKRWAEETGKWMVDTGKKIGEVVTGLWQALDSTQKFLGGWKNLGIAIVALNFAPTIVAIGNLAFQIGSLTRLLYSLAPAWVAGMGPIAWVVVAVGSVFFALQSIVNPGGPLDLLGKLFPETMQKVGDAVKGVAEWIEGKIDAITAKLRELIAMFDSITGLGIGDFFSKPFGGNASTGAPNYDLPKTSYGSILGVPPKGQPSPLVLPPQAAPPATKEDILNHLKPQSSNNTYNINVTAPNGDGSDIAERIRRAFERKPLYDSDGALAPG